MSFAVSKERRAASFITHRYGQTRLLLLSWREDPGHVERILEDIEMKDCKGSSFPGLKLQEEDGDDDELRGLDLTTYRSDVTRAKFVTSDRSNIRYSIKELCLEMDRPVHRSMERQKTLVRRLKAQSRFVSNPLSLDKEHV